jgi:hypothetical protein
VAAQAANEYDKATADARFVNVVGDTMTGTLTLAGAPANPLEAATKAYVDAKPAGAVIADTPPASPSQGQTWWESDSGAFYIWYNDGTSAQWVQVNAPSVPLVRTADNYNRIVNGAMQHSQENGNTAGSANGYFAVDQFFSFHSTTGTVSSQRVQSITPKGSANRYRITITVADTSLAAGEYLQILQALEGGRTADFGWGTAQAKPVVLRFGFKGPAGTYSAAFTNGAAVNRSYFAQFTISAGQANTDTEQVFVIPGDTTGTWVTDTTNSLTLRIVLAAGSGLFGTANAWQAGALVATASNTNGLATGGAVYELFDVGLYLDPNNTGVPPPWVTPDFAAELAACMRYWERPNVITSMVANAGPTFGFLAQKRTAPTLSASFGGGSGATYAMTGGSDLSHFYQSTVHNVVTAATITANARM